MGAPTNPNHLAPNVSSRFHTMSDNPFGIGCPMYAPFFGAMGGAMAMIFGAFGAAYGTAKSGAGIAAMGVLRPELAMKAVIPVIMAGIVGIYGPVVACLIAQGLKGDGTYS